MTRAWFTPREMEHLLFTHRIRLRLAGGFRRTFAPSHGNGVACTPSRIAEEKVDYSSA